MAFIISDIISAFTDAISAITSLFGNLGSALSGIANTGQGIFGGLFSYATALWNAIKYLADQILAAFEAIGTFFYNAFVAIGNELGTAFITVGTWLYSGLSTLGNWIWTAMQIIGQAVSWMFNALMNAIELIWTGLTTTLGTWFNDIAGAANSFISGLVTSWRIKMKQTLVADFALYFGWHGAEHAMNSLAEIGSRGESFEDSAKTVVTKIGLMLLEPFAGVLGGAILGEVLDALLPSTDLSVTLVPTFKLTPGTITMPRMNTPTGGTPPAPPSGTPTYGDTLTLTEVMEQGVSYMDEDSDLTTRTETEMDTVNGSSAYLDGESLNSAESLTITNS